MAHPKSDAIKGLVEAISQTVLTYGRKEAERAAELEEQFDKSIPQAERKSVTQALRELAHAILATDSAQNPERVSKARLRLIDALGAVDALKDYEITTPKSAKLAQEEAICGLIHAIRLESTEHSDSAASAVSAKLDALIREMCES